MGHNTSPRKRSAAVLRSPLADWSAWLLDVDCGGAQCPRGRRYNVAELVQFYPGRTVAGAIHRMRCSGCGCAPVVVAMRPKPGTAAREDVVALVGPGIV